MPQSTNSKQLKNTKSVINFQDIPDEVLDIIKKLQKNNFQAFIVRRSLIAPPTIKA